MAKSKKAMSKSLKSTGDAWRAHVANVAKQENVKYGKAMSLASKGKYGAEWKKIKAGMGSSKKAAVGGGDSNPYNEQNLGPESAGGGEPYPAEEGIGKNAVSSAMSGGRRRRTRKAKGKKGKRGGAVLGVPL